MKTKKLVTTAMLLAFALILSLIQIIKLPFGGSVTLVSMLPVILIGYMYGIKYGLCSAFVYSGLQMLVGFGTVSAFFLPGESQMALTSAVIICVIDYVLAYSVLGLGSVFKGKVKNDTLAFCLGVTVCILLRYIMHIISGYIFFGAWAEWFFADSTGLSQIGALKGFCSWVMSNFDGKSLSLFYSVIYNGSYMLPELIITLLVSPVVTRILKKANIM
ncbi:MAG: energy-coupled thiamine transporter ThiT [Clostridia bacterium]|nr:energy-coupled thiamine transporter ThiT [Clostridia bacterium]